MILGVVCHPVPERDQRGDGGRWDLGRADAAPALRDGQRASLQPAAVDEERGADALLAEPRRQRERVRIRTVVIGDAGDARSLDRGWLLLRAPSVWRLDDAGGQRGAHGSDPRSPGGADAVGHRRRRLGLLPYRQQRGDVRTALSRCADGAAQSQRLGVDARPAGVPRCGRAARTTPIPTATARQTCAAATPPASSAPPPSATAPSRATATSSTPSTATTWAGASRNMERRCGSVTSAEMAAPIFAAEPPSACCAP